jgi:chitinase
VSSGPDKFKILNIPAMNKLLDLWFLMAYDFSGSWDSVVGHQANLYPSKKDPARTPFTADYAVSQFIAKGATARKMILGMPLYGRQFAGATTMGKPFSGAGDTGSWEAGIWDYKVCSWDQPVSRAFHH